jgi:hypothetical protein
MNAEVVLQIIMIISYSVKSKRQELVFISRYVWLLLYAAASLTMDMTSPESPKVKFTFSLQGSRLFSKGVSECHQTIRR